MNEFLTILPSALLRSGLALTASAVVVSLMLRILKVSSPTIRRIAYLGVVVQGCLLVQTSVTLPLLKQSASADHQFAIFENIPDPAESDFVDASDDFSPLVSQSLAQSTSAWPQEIRKSPLTSLSWFESLGILWLAGIVAGLPRRMELRRASSATCLCGRNAILNGPGNGKTCSSKPVFGRWRRLKFRQSAGPMLCRFPRGYRLIVPAAYWGQLQPAQRLAVLQHELAHLQRRDIWKSLAIRIMALPHWFNPLVWWIVRRFDECAEWACDEAARAASPDHVAHYARALLQLGDRSGSLLLSMPAASGRGLSQRIRRLLSSTPWEDSKMKKFAVVAVVSMILLINTFKIELTAQDSTAPKTGADVSVDRAAAKGGGAVSGTTEASVIQTAAASGVAPNEAVVDLVYLTKNFKGFERDREKLKTEIHEGDNKIKMTKLSDEIRAASKELEELDTGTESQRSLAETLREELELKKANYDARRKVLQKRFLRREAAIYQTLYEKITAEVTAYAKEHRIRVVRRAQHLAGANRTDIAGSTVRITSYQGADDHSAESSDSARTGDLSRDRVDNAIENPSEIFKRMKQDVIYIERTKVVDITEEILKRLNEKDATAEKAGEAK